MTTLLLAMVLFSNVTFAYSVDIHLCQGKVESMAFFGQTATCVKMIQIEAPKLPPCCQKKQAPKGITLSQKSCCENVQLFQDNPAQKASDDGNLQALHLEISGIQWHTPTLFYVLSTTDQPVHEIHPPPILVGENSQEKLQVYQI